MVDLVGLRGGGRPEPLCFRVSGWSMEPTIPAGTEVLISRDIGKASPKVGEIILCRKGEGAHVLHRMIGRTEDGRLITKGDRERRPDVPWARQDLVGVMEAARFPGQGWVAPRQFWALYRHLLRLRRMPGYEFLSRILTTFLWTPACLPRSIQMPAHGENTGFSMSSQFGFDSQWLGNELAVHDPARRKVYFLNQVAAWIWEWASRGHGTQEIVARLRERFPETPESEIRDDVGRTVDQLRSLGVLPRENLQQH